MNILPMKHRIAHIITGLGVGGAERMLVKLLRELSDRYETHVICLGQEKALLPDIEATGATVHVLGLERRLSSVPGGVWRLSKMLRSLAPSLVQTWLYHADLLGGVAARVARVGPVIWNIRSTDLHGANNRSTRVAVWACANLSRVIPSAIVCCAVKAREMHVRWGYAEDKITVIPNGFSLSEFKPDGASKQDVRRELGLASDTPLIGLVARFDPQKNHALFLSAAKQLMAACPNVHFILIGTGIDYDNRELSTMIENAGVASNTRLLGRRRDIARLTSALDIATCCSESEGFPNALGEALSCGVPCVTTEVGDGPELVGASGRIVPRNDPEALARAWQELLQMPKQVREVMGVAARDRMSQEFEIGAIAERYAGLYGRVLQERVR